MFAKLRPPISGNGIPSYKQRYVMEDHCMLMYLCLVVLLSLFVVPGSAVLRTRFSRHGRFCSGRDQMLRNHVIAERDVKDEISCIIECVADARCRSVNFKKQAINSSSDAKCQLNNATKFSVRIGNYGKNLDNNHLFDSDDIPVSCSQIKVSVPSSTNGYYFVKDPSALCSPRLVYCDMEDGGGWTLVASISNISNNHLQTNKVNCLNNTMCVEYTTTNIQTRKIADDEIRALVGLEGVFRVTVLSSSPYKVFFKIPSGSQHFSSSCNALRIITSHSYPYHWEADCNGIHVGYRFGFQSMGSVTKDCYHVFDNEAFECVGTDWKSSKYYSERALYGFTCWNNKGIFSNQNGFLFVKG